MPSLMHLLLVMVESKFYQRRFQEADFPRFEVYLHRENKPVTSNHGAPPKRQPYGLWINIIQSHIEST